MGATGTYARFRISTDPALTLSTPSVNSVNGEIEDYRIPFQSPLPVKLISFKIAHSENEVRLTWVTADEMNTDCFNVEHSTDGKSFNKIGTVSAININNITNHYQFTYRQQGEDNHYYRLKMIDLDGTFAYSRMINVSSDGIVSSLYPNPVLNRTMYVKSNEKIESHHVFDASGKQVAMRMTARQGNIYQVTLAPDAQPGIYFLTYQVQGRVVQHKFVVAE